MFGLLIFGPKIEYTMGKRKFLTFYLICGVGSALFYMLVTGISNIPMVGASGAIFGVLTAYGVMYPKDIIYVQFFLPMPAIVFVIVYGLSQLIFGFASLLAPQLGGIAYFGHVGGLVTGLILVKFFGFNRKKVRYYWE
jgi:membrane associated rhomboid family serine protease